MLYINVEHRCAAWRGVQYARHRFIIICVLFFLTQSPVLRMAEGDTVYDYCWFPKMSSLEPDTCLWVEADIFLPNLN